MTHVFGHVGPGIGLAQPPRELDTAQGPRGLPAGNVDQFVGQLSPFANDPSLNLPQAQNRGRAPRGRRKRLAPSFPDNPIGAIGFVLQSVAAGLKGETLPIEKLQKQALAEQSFKLNRMKLAAGLVEQGIKTVERLPLDQQEAAAESFAAQFDLGEGFNLKQTILLGASQREFVLPGLKVVQFRPQAFSHCQNTKDPTGCVNKLITDKDYMDAVRTDIFTENRAVAAAKLGRLFSAVSDPKRLSAANRDSLNKALGQIPKDEQGNLLLSRTQLDLLMRGTGLFTEAERFTLQAPENADILTKLGIASPDITQAAAKAGAIEEAKRPSLARIEAEAQRREQGKAAGAKFKRREVNLRDTQNDEIISFVIDSPAAEARFDAMLSSKRFVKTSLDAKPQFQIVNEPVTNRPIVFNLITGRAEPLEDFFKRSGVASQEGEAPEGQPSDGEAGTAPAEPSPARKPRSGKRLSEVLKGPAFFRQVKRAVGLTIGQVGEAFGTEAASFPELATADTALGLFRNRMFSALRVKGQRLKIEAETLLSLVPSSYAVLQSGPAVNREFKELALRLNELRFEAERISNNTRVPGDEREEARVLAERLPNLIDDIFLTVKTPDELLKMPKGTTAFVLSEGDFFTRGK